MDPIQSPARRLFYLDTARGLAAVSVVIWHFFTAFAGYDASAVVYHSAGHLFWYGEADVIFFFVHSGFILTYSYANAESRLNFPGYARFLIERIFRIYPLFLFILAVSFILRSTVYPFSNGSYLSTHLLQFWNARKSVSELAKEAILVIRVPEDANDRFMPQDWTLTVELLFCPFIPFLSLLWRRGKWFFWPVVLIALKFLHFNTYLFEFATGVFIFSVEGYPESLGGCVCFFSDHCGGGGRCVVQLFVAFQPVVLVGSYALLAGDRPVYRGGRMCGVLYDHDQLIAGTTGHVQSVFGEDRSFLL